MAATTSGLGAVCVALAGVRFFFAVTACSLGLRRSGVPGLRV